MKKPQIRQASQKNIRQFQDLGFRDYLGARCLLLNGLDIQGATLASTALEKYLKCILATVGARVDVHLDRLKQFESVLVKHGIDICDELDPTFLETLSKAYRLRYYDTVATEVFGFFTWQLLGELDSTVALIESRLTLADSRGNVLPSEYRKAMDARDPTVCRENFVALGGEKKAFMERPGRAIMLGVGVAAEDLVITASEGMAVANYQGRMQTLTNIQIGS